MTWVKFNQTFRWKPKVGVSIRYGADMTLNVTQRCAAAAISRGAAVKATRPKENANGARGDISGPGKAGPEVEESTEGSQDADTGGNQISG